MFFRYCLGGIKARVRSKIEPTNAYVFALSNIVQWERQYGTETDVSLKVSLFGFTGLQKASKGCFSSTTLPGLLPFAIRLINPSGNSFSSRGLNHRR